MNPRGIPSGGPASDIGARRIASTPPGRPRPVTRATGLIVGAAADIGARRVASAPPGRPTP